jgi:DNA-binding winged helix-turn-helix (wHTH) protein
MVTRAAEMDDRPEEVTQGVWRLGRMASGHVLILVVSPSVLRNNAMIDRLRLLEPEARFTVIAVLKSVTEKAILAERGFEIIHPDDAFLPSEPERPVRLNLERIQTPAGSNDPDLLVVNPRSLAFTLGGKKVSLEPRDARVLKILAREASDGESPATRDDLYGALIDRDDSEAPVGDDQVDKSISRIRKNLAEVRGVPRSQGQLFIVAVRRVGYRIDTSRLRLLIK